MATLLEPDFWASVWEQLWAAHLRRAMCTSCRCRHLPRPFTILPQLGALAGITTVRGCTGHLSIHAPVIFEPLMVVGTSVIESCRRPSAGRTNKEEAPNKGTRSPRVACLWGTGDRTGEAHHARVLDSSFPT